MYQTRHTPRATHRGIAVEGVEVMDTLTTRRPAQPHDSLANVLADLSAVTDRLTAIINDDVFAIPTTTLTTAQAAVRVVENRLHAARLVMLPVIEQAGVWAHDFSQAAAFHSWLAVTDQITIHAAKREINTAHKLRDHLPVTRHQALTGKLGAGYLEAIVQLAPTSAQRCQMLATPIDLSNHQPPTTITTVDPNTGKAIEPGSEIEPSSEDVEDVADRASLTGEQLLLRFPAAYTVPQFRTLVKRFAHVADPAADERGYRQAEEREYLQLAATMNGYDIRGFLTPEHGQQLATAINALTTNTTGDIAADGRTPGQKRAQSLADLARLALDTGMLGGGAIEKRQIVVHISYNELQHLQNTHHNHHQQHCTKPASGSERAITLQSSGGRSQSAESRQYH